MVIGYILGLFAFLLFCSTTTATLVNLRSQL